MKPSPLFLKIIAASSIGTILEWYDFSLFAFLTPLLANQFFPEQNKFTGLMLTYAVFAIGFFIRPFGAVIFGHFGDRIGRKQTLIYSVVLMAVSTFLIGLLPTYQHIGIYAPILLILLRICQGLSAGGESTGAILFILETDQYKYRGFIGGLLWFVVSVGMLLGSLAATIAIAYSYYSWSWRIPFILGIFTGLIGYFIRKRTPETILFENLKKEALIKFPLYHGIIKYKVELLRIIGIYTLSAMLTYLIFIFMPTYAADIIGLPLATVTSITTIALACVAVLAPFAGLLSDIIGRKNCLRWPAIAIFILSYPLFILITQNSLQHFIIAEIFFVLFAACFQGAINAAVIEQVPTAIRYSVIAVGYNIAYSLFGGTAPIIASFIVTITDNKASPGAYLMLGAAIAILATYKMRKTNQLALDQI